MHVGGCVRGRALLMPLEYIPANELPDESYPLKLVTGRMLYHYNAGAMTQRTEGLNEIAPSSYVEMNQEDATRLGIAKGEKVNISSRRGKIETVVRLGNKTRVGEVFMTFHFDDGNANYLTNSATDKLSRIPEFKVCAVKVEKQRAV